MASVLFIMGENSLSSGSKARGVPVCMGQLPAPELGSMLMLWIASLAALHIINRDTKLRTE